jgi:hypothetical protein
MFCLLPGSPVFQVTKSGEPVTDLWSDRQHKLPFEMIWIFASSQNTIKIPGKTNWNLASYKFSVKAMNIK